MSPRDDTDRRIAALATAQHGPVAHRQLLALGLTHEQIAYRLRVGRLVRHHPDVFLVGHQALSRHGRWMAAVLASGPGAVLSRWDAAALWGLAQARGGRIHVTRPSSSGRDPDPSQIRLHRVRTLRPWETTITDGIPAITVARTLLELAPHLRPAALEDLIARADRLALFDLVAVRRCLREHPRQHGAPRLRLLLAELHGVGASDLRSELEIRMLQVCADHELPRPVVNARVAGHLADFFWPHAKLVVETDGYAYHTSRQAFERDRTRDQDLTLAGYTVLRFTYNQVTRTPEAVAHRIRRLLR